MDDFHQRGVEIAAISVDSTEESRKLAAGKGYTFPLLSDPKADVIRSYGLLHARGGEDGRDISRPAEILVDSSRSIRWEYLTDDLRIRARPEVVLEAVEREIPK